MVGSGVLGRWPGGRAAELSGFGCCLGDQPCLQARFDTKFSQHAGDMDGGRPLADEQLTGDLAIGTAKAQQEPDLTLALS